MLRVLGCVKLSKTLRNELTLLRQSMFLILCKPPRVMQITNRPFEPLITSGCVFAARVLMTRRLLRPFMNSVQLELCPVPLVESAMLIALETALVMSPPLLLTEVRHPEPGLKITVVAPVSAMLFPSAFVIANPSSVSAMPPNAVAVLVPIAAAFAQARDAVFKTMPLSTVKPLPLLTDSPHLVVEFEVAFLSAKMLPLLQAVSEIPLLTLLRPAIAKLLPKPEKATPH